MRYVSTRGGAPPISFDDALLAGLAPDGGLYVPETWPSLDEVDPNAGYAAVAAEILAPFVEGSVLAGRLGAGMGAEIGSMRVTEQIDALEVAALKPYDYLVVTRVLACVIIFPILTIWTDALAMLGGYLESLLSSGTDYRVFFDTAISSLRFHDIIIDTMKTSIFGFIVAMVSCWLGYTVRGGTREVGQATMQAVVVSSLLIFLADVILVRISITFL